MKIDYISTYSMPSERAVGIQISNTCSAMAKMGIEVNLWIPKKDKNFDTSSIFSFYGVEKNFNIKPVFIKRFSHGQIRHFLNTFLYLKSLQKKIDRSSVIYSRDQLTGLFFRNFIFEVHYLPVKPYWFHKLLWQRASAFVVLTSFMKKQLIDGGFDSKKIHIASDAISQSYLSADISKAEARQKLQLPLEKKIIAYIGKYQTPFAESKGVAELIQGFSLVAKSIPTAFLLLVGIGNRHMAEVEEKIRQEGIDLVNTKVINHVAQSEVINYLKSADILAITPPWSHYNAYLTSPMKLFEYMAINRPIVASDLPSIIEIVDASAVCLVKPGDTQSLANGIEKILDDDEYGNSIAEQAKIKAYRYTWDNRARGIIKFVEKIKSA